MDDAFGQVLDATYATATDPGAWRPLLERLARLFRCHFADVFVRTDDFGRYRGIAHGLDESDYQQGLLDTWVKRNAWSKARPVRRAGDVVTTREMVAPEELMRTEIYAEYLGPRDLSEGLRLDIWAGEGWMHDVSLIRSWSAGAYDRREVAMGRRLLPHLQRAAGIARQLDDATAMAHAGMQALDAIHRPAVVADAAGRIVAMNRLGEAMVDVSAGVTTAGRALAGPDAAATDSLLGMVGRAAHGRLSSDAAWRTGRGEVRVTALPLSPDRFALPGPSALLVFAEQDEPPAQPMAERFGLTQTEAAVAEMLAAGRSAAEIAGSMGRSVNTVRSHIARLMFKTGTNRQVTLMQVLTGRSPARRNALR